MARTTHSICSWSPVDADSRQSTLLSIHLQAGTSDDLVVHVAHVVNAGLFKENVWDTLMALHEHPLKEAGWG